MGFENSAIKLASGTANNWYGPRTKVEDNLLAGEIKTSGRRREVRMVIKGTAVPSAVTYENSVGKPQASIPAGAYIESARLIVTTAFTSGGLATLTIGTYYDNSGSLGTLDADGIDAAIAVAALTDLTQIACDGAQVNAVLAATAGDYKLGVSYGTAAFTAGEAELVVTYIVPEADA